MKKTITTTLVLGVLVGIGALVCYSLTEEKELVFNSPEFWEETEIAEVEEEEVGAPIEAGDLVDLWDPIVVDEPAEAEEPTEVEKPTEAEDLPENPELPQAPILDELPSQWQDAPEPVQSAEVATYAFTPDLSWSRGVSNASLTKCLILAVSSPTSVEVDRKQGPNEIFPVGTGSAGLLLTPLCHTYTTDGNYTPEIQGDGIIYLDYGRQAVTAFVGASYPSLTYLSLVENTLTAPLITTLFPSLPALRELNLADTALSISDYNDLLLSLSGSVATGILNMGSLQYGGCSETLSGEATTAHADLLTAGWTLIDGGQAVCTVPTPESSSNGGGSSLTKDVCPNGDFSPSYYDNTCGGSDEEHGVAEDDQTSDASEAGQQSLYKTAYQWAKEYGITTSSTYEDTRISDTILRQEMAKMISTYAIKLLNKIPDTSKVACSQFQDVSEVPTELQPYIIQSCELGLMGMHGDGIQVQDNFFPKNSITRAEVGTILSRLLRGTTYATQESDETYYSRHLQALKKAGIMNFISNPDMLELRGNILLMLWKSVTWK